MIPSSTQSCWHVWVLGRFQEIRFQRNWLCLFLNEKFICPESQHFAVSSAHKSSIKDNVVTCLHSWSLLEPTARTLKAEATVMREGNEGSWRQRSMDFFVQALAKPTSLNSTVMPQCCCGDLPSLLTSAVPCVCWFLKFGPWPFMVNECRDQAV